MELVKTINTILIEQIQSTEIQQTYKYSQLIFDKDKGNLMEREKSSQQLYIRM